MAMSRWMTDGGWNRFHKANSVPVGSVAAWIESLHPLLTDCSECEPPPLNVKNRKHPDRKQGVHSVKQCDWVTLRIE